ncbi:MAG: hydroxymethylbilane synthase [Acidobacteria bacterium]|nr:hydroxymethylbilane synthase [Acidobacteriota bacterium]
MAQTALAEQDLRRAGAARLETVVIRTTGDRRPSTPLQEMPGQGWFSAELERALIDERADLAVHSAKDLASAIPAGLELCAVLERGDPRDGVVSRDGIRLAELPAGARVGTSSVRREALIASINPGVQTVAIRGNVDTRLGKLESGEFDALVVACAGLDRLDRGDVLTERLDPERFVPAPAQGAIALEAKRGSSAAALATTVSHGPSMVAVRAERAVLGALGGGCLLPLGVWARFLGDRLLVTAWLRTADGRVRRAELEGGPDDPEALGRQVASQLQ